MSANTTVLFGKFPFGAYTTLDVGLPSASVQSSLKTVCPGITKVPAPALAATSCALSPAGAVGDKNGLQFVLVHYFVIVSKYDLQ